MDKWLLADEYLVVLVVTEQFLEYLILPDFEGVALRSMMVVRPCLTQLGVYLIKCLQDWNYSIFLLK